MVKVLAYPVMVVSAVGVILCLTCFVVGSSGVHDLPKEVAAILFGGVFVVWLPTVLLMNRLTRDFKQKDIWKAALRGCPPWMRTTLWIVVGLVMAVTFMVPIVSGQSPGQNPNGFSLFPISFYAVSFCVMYSLIHVDEVDTTSRCLNGHVISPLAKFCEECGAPAAPEEMRGPGSSLT